MFANVKVTEKNTCPLNRANPGIYTGMLKFELGRGRNDKFRLVKKNKSDRGSDPEGEESSLFVNWAHYYFGLREDFGSCKGILFVNREFLEVGEKKIAVRKDVLVCDTSWGIADTGCSPRNRFYYTVPFLFTGHLVISSG